MNLKRRIKNLFLPALLPLLSLTPPAHVFAQTFTTLHAFAPTYLDAAGFYYTNIDGANPHVALILSGNTLYGAAYNGGFYGSGTVFAINTDGTNFTNLHNFARSAWVPVLSGGQAFTNSDGAMPFGQLILSGNALYGATSRGGTNGNGTVFKVNMDGTGFTNLHIFTAGDKNSISVYTNSDGAIPQTGLILSGGTL